jgi:PAS domain-containing protein
VLELVAQGRRSREVASTLAISERAVTAHITRLMAHFGVSSRAGLIAAALAVAPQLHDGGNEFAAYEDAPFLVAVTRGTRHVFTFVNRMWERVMHVPRANALGRTVREVFPDASRATYRARQRALASGRPTTGNAWHFAWTAADGAAHETDFRYLYQPLYDRLGRIEGVLLIATEVTPTGNAGGRARVAPRRSRVRRR